MPKYTAHRTVRRTRTTMVEVAMPTNFQTLGTMLGQSPATIAKRYHAAKAQNPRKVVSMATLRGD